MLMKTEQGFLDLIGLKQLKAMARILTGNQVDRLQDLDGSNRNIFEISDRCGNKVKFSVHIFTR